MKPSIDVYDLGFAPYKPVWELQRTIQKLLIDQKKGREPEILQGGEMNDILLFVEHPHVYTLGKSGDATHLLKGIAELTDINAEFIEIDRGGDITYHGPGQIVGYPILDLDRYFTDIRKYLRYLEEVIIRSCSDFGVKAGRIQGLTGVWVGDKKICAMGIRCSRWVTMHGFALNVNTDLQYFDHIVPCGIRNKSVTSLSELIGEKVEEYDVRESIVHHFSDVFNTKIKEGGSIAELDPQFSYL